MKVGTTTGKAGGRRCCGATTTGIPTWRCCARPDSGSTTPSPARAGARARRARPGSGCLRARVRPHEDTRRRYRRPSCHRGDIQLHHPEQDGVRRHRACLGRAEVAVVRGARALATADLGGGKGRRGSRLVEPERVLRQAASLPRHRRNRGLHKGRPPRRGYRTLPGGRGHPVRPRPRPENPHRRGLRPQRGQRQALREDGFPQVGTFSERRRTRRRREGPGGAGPAVGRSGGVEMPITITEVVARDIRFPTSENLDGSDAMNQAPDYSAAYAIVKTDTHLEGHGLTFTIGRGNELCVAAIEALAPLVVGSTLESFTENMGAFWDHVTGDSQLRWVGPEKGVIHLATAAIVNAVWDLYAKVEGKPLWKLLSDMRPEELVSCVPFRYITDAVTPEEALEILRENEATKGNREAEMLRDGFPAYTTSAGWLGYPDEKVRRLSREAVEAGWEHVKIKVGMDIEDDARRAALVREEIGPDRKLMLDANQVWDVGEAIENIERLARFDPYWIEEPTSPDDVLGHAEIAKSVAPVGVATGEHCQNRVLFKQLFQADAISFCQIDACRLGGVNEVVAVLLMAKKFGVPVCPHAGGVGLCEYVQHLSIFDYIAIGASLEDRILEYVDHLQEHFLDPVRMENGRYIPPSAPGYSIEMKPESLEAYEFPNGNVWTERTRSNV